MSALGRELVRHHDEIAHRWYELWRRSSHPSDHLSEAALKDSLPRQLRFVGEQLERLAEAEPPSEMWKVVERLDPEARVAQEMPIEQVVREYELAVDVVRQWVIEREIDVSFDEHTYFLAAMFELAAESARRYEAHRAKVVRRERGEYLAAVMHQLRTPLSVVAMSASLLDDERAASEATRARLRRAVHRMQSLVDGILRLERYKPEELPVSPESFDLADWVPSLVEDYAHDAERKGLRLDVSVEPSLRVRLDPNLLADALGNLVQNAVKFTSSGAVELECVPEGEGILLVVRDTGRGIDPERARSLFEEPQPGEGGGAGIGLLIAASAVRAMGGSIDVSSEPGRGSLFTLRLPRRVASRAEC